ncbi:hypothetical protein Fuma_04316 [Fuerstiella marisgermanici]|uniref:Uncharacterized protein n=1 Tax=Fuerstiella marisgermanici TaxID=1891926 RepID=A0A1P8WKV7_9PLAN|nr:hypothetical protein Fuma_04316 [Fuerstiella marisgermanici]
MRSAFECLRNCRSGLSFGVEKGGHRGRQSLVSGYRMALGESLAISESPLAARSALQHHAGNASAVSSATRRNERPVANSAATGQTTVR